MTDDELKPKVERAVWAHEQMCELLGMGEAFEPMAVLSEAGRRWLASAARCRQLEADKAKLVGFLKQVASPTSYECDNDAHRHGTPCWQCEAARVLAGVSNDG